MTHNFMRRGNPAIGEHFTCWGEQYIITAITGKMDDDGYVPVEAKKVESWINPTAFLEFALLFAFGYALCWLIVMWMNF